jgi:hypothetical protein
VQIAFVIARTGRPHPPGRADPISPVGRRPGAHCSPTGWKSPGRTCGCSDICPVGRLLSRYIVGRPGEGRGPWAAAGTPRRTGYRSLAVGRPREECLVAPWHWTLQLETSRLICRLSARKLISIVRQPVLVPASRCYLIQMLRSAMTCANGCSCWSPDEENSPRNFLTMDALYRLS